MKLAIRTAAVPLLLALTLLTAGCGSSDNTPQLLYTSNSVVFGPGVVVKNADFIATITAQVNDRLSQNPESAEDWIKFLEYFGDIMLHASYDVELHKVRYPSTGADGSVVMLSGLVILPRQNDPPQPTVPIMMYQHATEPYSALAPSGFLTVSADPLNYPEVLFSIAMAMTGYSVALPDYEGMGINTNTQPFVHAKTLAVQVVDMLRATRDALDGAVTLFTPPCSWNGKLFLMGYSEGGFVTLAATRELQQNAAAEFTVTASVPLSGPHDLSGTMRSVILSDKPFKSPYFLPFLLSSYYSVYHDPLLSPAYTMNPPYNSTLPPLFDGKSTSEAINIAMGMSYDPVNLIVPKSILTSQFIADLQNTGSAAYGYLVENDTYRNWAPTVPVRLYHNVNDDLVPFGNSQVAFAAFSSAGAKPWVSLVPTTDTVNISNSPVPTIHVAAAIPELHDSWYWIFTNYGN
ncbi:MAG: lipase family protein [Geobacteraceae bacterium]|nr:lipase family protein [Geobacteraceae bacterium]